MCERLRVPLAPEKVVSPTTRLMFLGIEIDTHALQMRLLPEKLVCLTACLSSWPYHLHRDRESLIGLLSHACKVIWLGQSGCSTTCEPKTLTSDASSSTLVAVSTQTWHGDRSLHPHETEYLTGLPPRSCRTSPPMAPAFLHYIRTPRDQLARFTTQLAPNHRVLQLVLLQCTEVVISYWLSPVINNYWRC